MTEKYTIDEWRDAFMAESGMHGGRDMTESAFDDVVKRLRAPKPKFAEGQVLCCQRTSASEPVYVKYKKTFVCPEAYRTLTLEEHGPNVIPRELAMKLREFVEWAATGKHVPDFVSENAKSFLAEFDASLEESHE